MGTILILMGILLVVILVRAVFFVIWLSLIFLRGLVVLWSWEILLSCWILLDTVMILLWLLLFLSL